MFGLHLGRMGRMARRGAFQTDDQKILALFASGEQGAWYDPSDMSTLFQDSAFTVPGALEQPVGSMLDLSGRGNHASMVTTPKRPIYSRRVNLHTASEFPAGTADVPVSGGNLTAGSIAGYPGAIAFGVGTDTYAYKNNFTVLEGIEYIFSVVVQMTDGLAPNFAADHTPENDFGLIIGTNAAGIIDPRTYSVVNLGSGTYRVSGRRVINANSPLVGVLKRSTSSNRTFKVTAYDIRLHIDARLPYQRVNTDTEYDADPNKFPAYLRFDGVDDAMQTGNIDFTGTDKTTVWAGVTKLSDAANGLVYEFGSPESVSVGSFSMWAPINFASTPLGVTAKGASRSVAATSAFSGIASGVVAHDINLSEPRNALRLNGTTLSTQTTALGGSFGNYPLYIGARAGTSIYFNGRLYSLIVRGAQSSLSQIEATEAYIKQKMRLP